jgi:hypothetical protein
MLDFDGLHVDFVRLEKQVLLSLPFQYGAPGRSALKLPKIGMVRLQGVQAFSTFVADATAVFFSYQACGSIHHCSLPKSRFLLMRLGLAVVQRRHIGRLRVARKEAART